MHSRRGNRSESLGGYSVNTELSKKENKSDRLRKESEKTDKQAKIDELMSLRTKGDMKACNSDVQDNHDEDSGLNFKVLMKIVTRLEEKVNELASKEYINTALDKRLEGLGSEKLFNDKLDVLKSDIGNDIKLEIDKVYEHVRSVKSRLKSSESEIEQLKNSKSDLREEVERVKGENDKLKERNKELNSKINYDHDRIKYSEFQLNELEKYTRRNSVRIYGLDDADKNESPIQTEEKVVKLLKNKLDMSIEVTDIDIAHRQGKFSVGGNRPVLCKFVHRTHKLNAISARKKLKGSRCVIREDFTLKNAKMLEKLTSKEEVANCWSDEGKIIALLTNGKKMKIDMYVNLDRSLLAS
ncbi:myosin-13-like [Mercenaria mercenaria]|uniref:myosin-13-like n=1 Tax=Mercenaria mercenaria TaxID=6596 RepID=UPI00234E58FF|nr:myosin-13-like [Mercenaria mercenaria]